MFVVFVMLAASTVWPRAAVRGPVHAHPSAFHWLVPPLVRVCRRSELSLERVREAVAFWAAHGPHFRTVVSAECAFSPDGTPLDRTATAPAFNTITLARLGQLSPAGKAGASHWAFEGGVPYWAVVLLPPVDPLPFVLEHELGHALGFPHVHVRGHVMNPRAEEMGASVAGLELLPR